MCGITGILNRQHGDRHELTQEVSAMASSLGHRGPDDCGTWIDASQGVALGHRRLAILDLSSAGHQPMVSSCGRYILTYNGEVYNFRSLREELISGGYVFRSDTDTEVVLSAIAAWGLEKAVARFEGMFAFALWDREEHTLSLVRDRLGVKPLYLYHGPGYALFGSELKALCAHPAFPRKIDRSCLTPYLRYAYIPAPRTIYANTEKVLPGHIIRMDRTGRLSDIVYWDANRIASEGLVHQLEGSEEELTNALDARLREAIGMRMIADVPLGVFFSGGIDSTTVAALMQAQSRRPVKAFTIGFPDIGYDETPYAIALAKQLGLDHTVFPVTAAEAWHTIAKLPEWYDEPFADSSAIPTYLVSRLARQSVTVALSGDGGDELFGGYNRYRECRRLSTCLRILPGGIRELLSRAARLPAPSVLQKLGKLFGYPQQFPEKVAKLAHVLDAKDGDAMYQVLASIWCHPESAVLMVSEDNQIGQLQSELPVTDVLDRMMLLDLQTYLPDDILVKVDRASMAVGLEARGPFLDHGVLEWAWRLPRQMKVRRGEGKWILKQVLGRYVSPNFLERPKMGFALPLDSWLRGPLRSWAESLLCQQELKKDGFFNGDVVARCWQDHLAGRGNWQHQLWCVLMFQAWLRKWAR